MDSASVLLIFGSGPREEEILTAAAPSPGRIKFLGRVPFAWLATILQYCDVGLLPYSASSTVTLPDKFYDYSNAGIPIITSIRGEVGQIIKNNGIGELYEAGSAQSLSLALTRMTRKENWRTIGKIP